MRPIFIAIAAVLAVGIATPTLAAVKHYDSTPSYNTCEALSVQRGAAPGRGGGTNANAQHDTFMRQCLEGKIPL